MYQAIHECKLKHMFDISKWRIGTISLIVTHKSTHYFNFYNRSMTFYYKYFIRLI